MNFKHLDKWLKIIFLTLILLFLYFYLRGIDFNALNAIEIDWGILLFASFISLLFRYWGVVIWRYILSDLGATHLPKFWLLSDIYAKAWMGRYIPGTVTWIASKVYLASKLGISKSRLTISSLLEGGMQVVASLSVALLILGLNPRLDIIPYSLKIIMVVVGIASLITLLPPVLNRLVTAIYRLIRQRDAHAELHTNFKATLRSYLLYAIGTIITGSSYYFLTISLYPSVGMESYWYIVGVFTLAGALGMATPFVPSGLGVRDGVQLVLLALIMPKEIALAITVFSRLWSLAIDIVFYLFTRPILKSQRGSHEEAVKP